MRQIHTFKYYNKTFLCGELTVGDYLLFLDNAEFAIEKILLEFNKKLPAMNESQSRLFIRVLFAMGGEVTPQVDDITDSQKQKSGQILADFHIYVGYIMRTLHQPYSEIMQMPYRVFSALLEDMEIIVGQKEYDANRHDTTPDKKGFKEVFGNSNLLKSQS